jgi:FtsP/CotA-like multicopper oxidase with cupredoxin domain
MSWWLVAIACSEDPGDKPWVVPPLSGLPPLSEALIPEPATAPDLDPTEGVMSVALVADEAVLQRAGMTIEGFAFDGQVPGPTIRATLGDLLEVEVTNALDAETTVHWHGLEVPWSQDGVSWMSDPIAPGESRTYAFRLQRAGTFWYHPHMDVGHQVDWGLYGALVVDDPNEPATDVDRVFVLDDWSETHGEEEGHHADTSEGIWTVNGIAGGRIELDAGSTARARFINVSNHGYVDLDAGGRAIAHDQGLVDAPDDATLLGPGDRVEVEWIVGSTPWDVTDAPHTLVGPSSWQHDEVLFEVEVEGTASTIPILDWPFAATGPSADPGHTDVLYVLQGDGENMLINGEVYPDVTIQEIAVGAPSIVEVRNLSATEHTFHLHGMRFEVLSIDDEASTVRTFEDTINVPIRSRARLLVVPNEPGDWMVHCHILDHEHLGMMTVLRVTGP